MTPLARDGWQLFPAEPAVTDWIAHTLPVARKALRAPENAGWLRCGGTWFAGVDVLPNDPTGAIGTSGPLAGRAVTQALHASGLADVRWHRGQLSVVHPGYPRPMAGESKAAFQYRSVRDAAHLDGLLPVGPNRRRMLREPHAFILGLPLTPADPGAAPLAVYEGSHHLIRRALAAVLEDVPPADWPGTDLTEAYQTVRKEAFASCRRVTLQPAPGQAMLIHRLALHGIAPWQVGAPSPSGGRMIAYFRPVFPPSRITEWLGRG